MNKAMSAPEIKALRHRLGISQEEMARRLGVSHYTVLRWENAQTTPSPIARRLLEDFARQHPE